METSSFIHILITIIGIIGAGAVALVCDMLKTNNERLREANLELQIRREEEQRRAEQAMEQLKRIAPLAVERGLSSPSRRILAPAEPAAIGAGEAGNQAGATMPEARTLAREFLTALTARPSSERTAPRRVDAAPVSAEPEAVSSVTKTVEPTRGPRKNWELLLKGAARRTTIEVTPVPAGRQRGELIPFESLQTGHTQSEPERLRLPSGFHGIGELSQLLELSRPLTGLVISISLSGNAASETGSLPSDTMRGAAEEWVRSMLEPGEFGCQSATDQFLIVIPAAREVVQGRLTEITEKLWDYQLREDVSAKLMLSWGSYQASEEVLSDAIRSAIHRMEENRRNRMAGSPGSGTGRRRLVLSQGRNAELVS